MGTAILIGLVALAIIVGVVWFKRRKSKSADSTQPRSGPTGPTSSRPRPPLT